MPDPKQVPRRCEFEQDKLILKLDEVYASEVSVIDAAADRITRLLERSGFQEGIEKIDLALREALANAILHGNRKDPAKAVRICVALEENGGVLIVVKDAGSGFDPNQLPNPVRAENLLAEHGRGVFLINQLMDKVEFRFGTGTEIYMRRNPKTGGATKPPGSPAEA